MTIRFLSSLLLCLLWIAPASAEVYKFTLSYPPDKAADLPKVKAIGDLVVNGAIRLPAYKLTMQDGIAESGWSSTTPKTLKITGHLDPKAAGKLAAYYHANGWILAPRAWKVTRGALGVDGSGVLSFAPPTGQGHLTYWMAGACVGCAQSTASVFFPEARRNAQKNEFLFYDGTNVPLKTVRIRPKMMAYHAVVTGQPIDGLAFYDGESDFQFFHVEVSLPAGERNLATPILNWFLPPK